VTLATYPAALRDINCRFMPWPVQSMPGTYNSSGVEESDDRNDLEGFNRVTCTKLFSVTCGRGQEGSDITVSVNVLVTISASLSATPSAISTCRETYRESRCSLWISWVIVHNSACCWVYAPRSWAPSSPQLELWKGGWGRLMMGI